MWGLKAGLKTAPGDLKGLHRVNKEHGHPLVYQRWALPLVLVATGALYAWGTLHNAKHQRLRAGQMRRPLSC